MNMRNLLIISVLLFVFVASEVVYAQHPLDTDGDGIPGPLGS